jgi:hypothetical protein
LLLIFPSSDTPPANELRVDARDPFVSIKGRDLRLGFKLELLRFGVRLIIQERSIVYKH